MSDDRVEWAPLTSADLPAIVALAGRCLAADGGLPHSAEGSFVARRFVAPGGRALGGVAGGELVAAGGVVVQTVDGRQRATISALVDPAWRGRGHGTHLLDWCLATGRELSGRVVVESESLTEAAAELLAGRGLRQVFAEDILRFDLAGTPLPEASLPDDVRLAEWTSELAERFFATYQASFRDRPGFPGWTALRWIDWIQSDDEFRPQWSLLATTADEGDLAFIVSAQDWVVQVGVRPDRRGRGLGAALVVEALRRMREAGAAQALLDVNVNNPAGALYRRLGFVDIGRRARYE
ncbi:MAG TPA: GNAT family N-acetyltransferase [Micromonosporaceae bacterium]|nr:GNAT family N-acetyltransferase [Micromonosporaceae bacterium]